MIHVNRRPGVGYVFYIDLLVICCMYHAENIEIGSMIIRQVLFSNTLIHNKSQFTQLHNALLRVAHKFSDILLKFDTGSFEQMLLGNFNSQAY
jgi:hypothetical protein